MATKQNTVTVFCSLPSGFVFDLPAGKKLHIKGMPVSNLMDGQGEFLPAGKYGITPTVKAEDWEYVQKTFAECDFLKNRLIFAETKMESGMNKAKMSSSIKHGLEQADVYNRERDSRLPTNKTVPFEKE